MYAPIIWHPLYMYIINARRDTYINTTHVNTSKDQDIIYTLAVTLA